MNSPFVTFEEVTTTPGPTQGLTIRQVKWDIRNGHLPGSIDQRGRIVIRRGDWEAFCAGTWPEVAAESRKPIGLHTVKGKVA